MTKLKEELEFVKFIMYQESKLRELFKEFIKHYEGIEQYRGDCDALRKFILLQHRIRNMYGHIEYTEEELLNAVEYLEYLEFDRLMDILSEFLCGYISPSNCVEIPCKRLQLIFEVDECLSCLGEYIINELFIINKYNKRNSIAKSLYKLLFNHSNKVIELFGHEVNLYLIKLVCDNFINLYEDTMNLIGER